MNYLKMIEIKEYIEIHTEKECVYKGECYNNKVDDYNSWVRQTIRYRLYDYYT